MDAFSRPRPAVKVLVVEDEPILAENIGAYLSALGATVRLAGDGASALALCSDFRPEVVVLDYHLPDMHGLALLDALRRCGCLGACVLVTAQPRHELLEQARRRGIVQILTKPFALADLAARVLGATAGRR